MEYQHAQHNVHLVVYHIIWCPKRRRKLLVGPVHDRLKQLMQEVATAHDWTIIQLAIQPDPARSSPIMAICSSAPIRTRCPQTSHD